MKFNTLISTTSKRCSSAIQLAEDIYIQTGITSIIVCQTFDRESNAEFSDEIHQAFSIFYADQRGLSKSRNLAIKLSNADFGFILDDDVSLNFEGFKQTINFLSGESEFAAVTCKFLDDDGRTRKSYKTNIFRHNLRTIMQVSSIEIILNLNFIKENCICFDERFGLGAIYSSGEENIILSDIIGSGGEVCYYPSVNFIHPVITSASGIYSHAMWVSKGALIRRIFGFKGVFAIIPFLWRRFFSNNLKISNSGLALFLMLKGFLHVR